MDKSNSRRWGKRVGAKNGLSFLHLAFLHLRVFAGCERGLIHEPAVTRVAPFPILCSATFKLEIP